MARFAYNIKHIPDLKSGNSIYSILTFVSFQLYRNNTSTKIHIFILRKLFLSSRCKNHYLHNNFSVKTQVPWHWIITINLSENELGMSKTSIQWQFTSNISSRDTSILQWPPWGCRFCNSSFRIFSFCTRSRLYFGTGESFSLSMILLIGTGALSSILKA